MSQELTKTELADYVAGRLRDRDRRRQVARAIDTDDVVGGWFDALDTEITAHGLRTGIARFLDSPQEDTEPLGNATSVPKHDELLDRLRVEADKLTRAVVWSFTPSESLPQRALSNELLEEKLIPNEPTSWTGFLRSRSSAVSSKSMNAPVECCQTPDGGLSISPQSGDATPQDVVPFALISGFKPLRPAETTKVRCQLKKPPIIVSNPGRQVEMKRDPSRIQATVLGFESASTSRPTPIPPESVTFDATPFWGRLQQNPAQGSTLLTLRGTIPGIRANFQVEFTFTAYDDWGNPLWEDSRSAQMYYKPTSEYSHAGSDQTHVAFTSTYAIDDKVSDIRLEVTPLPIDSFDCDLLDGLALRSFKELHGGVVLPVELCDNGWRVTPKYEIEHETLRDRVRPWCLLAVSTHEGTETACRLEGE